MTFESMDLYGKSPFMNPYNLNNQYTPPDGGNPRLPSYNLPLFGNNYLQGSTTTPLWGNNYLQGSMPPLGGNSYLPENNPLLFKTDLTGVTNFNPYGSGGMFNFDMMNLTMINIYTTMLMNMLSSMSTNPQYSLPYQSTLNGSISPFGNGMQSGNSPGLWGGGSNFDYNPKDYSYFNYDIDNLKAKWRRCKPHLSDQFYQKVVKIAKEIKCDPNDLMALMNSESGINPKARNSNGGATGLIQFMPSTAKDLGTTTDKLMKMTAEEQLDYVEKCIKKSKKMAGYSQNDKLDAGTLYALIFLPGRAKRDILTTHDEKYYKANTGLDRDHNGDISKKDLASRIRSCMA